MVELMIKNLHEVEEDYRDKVKVLCEEKTSYYSELFKKYEKDLILEVIFDHSSSVYKVSVSLNMKSKKILLVEESKEVIDALNTLFSKFKKTVKRQYDLERKDYEYKRKR